MTDLTTEGTPTSELDDVMAAELLAEVGSPGGADGTDGGAVTETGAALDSGGVVSRLRSTPTRRSPGATAALGARRSGLDSVLAGMPSALAGSFAGSRLFGDVGRSSSLAAMQAVMASTRFPPAFDTAAMRGLTAALGPQPGTTDLLNVAGVSSQLSATLASFTAQRPLLEAAFGGGVANPMLAAQFGQIASSQDAISRLVFGVDDAGTSALLASVGRYGQVQASLGALVAADRAGLLRGLTRVPGRRYDSYLDGLPARPTSRRAAVAAFGGNAQSGMVIAESLTAVGLDDDDREDLAEQYTVEVLEPWQTGPEQARQELFAALAAVKSDLPDWLKAAWDDIERDGPKAASKIANCMVECIDQTLRVLAAVDDVTAWIGLVGKQPGWLDNGGRPTRRAKIMFVMRARSKRDGRLAVSQVEALAALVQDVMGDLQTVKHGEAPSIASMRGMVLAIEGALSQLLLHR